MIHSWDWEARLCLLRLRVKSCESVLQNEGYHDPVVLLLSNFHSFLTKMHVVFVVRPRSKIMQWEHFFNFISMSHFWYINLSSPVFQHRPMAVYWLISHLFLSLSLLRYLCSLDSHSSSRCWRLWTALKRSSSSFRLSTTGQIIWADLLPVCETYLIIYESLPTG